MILACFHAKGYQEAGIEEMRAIHAALQRRLPSRGNTSFSYIATVLEEAGVKVHYAGAFASIEEPYASQLKGVLHFHDFAAAEASLRNLDAAYREYVAAHDHKGIGCVRKILLKGKQRAERLAASRRVSEQKRREKREIAGWFRVWLENPDIFFDWLALRKQTEEFQGMFGNGSGSNAR